MKQKLLLAAALSMTLFGAVGCNQMGGSQIATQQNSQTSSQASRQVPTQPLLTKQAIIKNADFDQQPHYELRHYENKKYGFSFDYPEKPVYDAVSGKNVIVQVYERGNQVIIAKVGLKTDADFAVNKGIVKDYRGPQFLEKSPSWIFTVNENVVTEKDIEKVAQTAYGTTCNQFPMQQAPVGKTVMAVGPLSDGLAPEQGSKCWLNYLYDFFWNKEKGVVVYWDQGQKPQFWVDKSMKGAYDLQMKQSFKFD